MSELPNLVTEAVLTNIAQRRTVPWQRLKTDPIRADHLAAILEAANWAPSHLHTEPWRFFLFRGAGRQTLADLLGAAYTAASGDQFKQAKYDKSQSRALTVPLTIALIMRPSTAPVLPEFEEMMTMGAVMQNLHLAAHSLGIGCALSTPGFLEHDLIRDFFKLEAQDRCLGFFYLGYRADEGPSSKRGPVNEKITVIEA